MAAWRENHRDYLLSTARSLSIPHEEFRAVTDEEAVIVLESIRQAFGNTPWWHGPSPNLPSWARHLPEDQSFRLITQVVPDPSERVWFVALHHGERGLLFESVPNVIERLLGETHLFEYVVVSKRLDWLLGEEDHGVFVSRGQRIVERLLEVLGPSVG